MKKITINNNNNNNGTTSTSTASGAEENVRAPSTIINLHETRTTASAESVEVEDGIRTNATLTRQDNVEVVKSLQRSKNNSVAAQTSPRSNFKKSNTCGSLFAKCACDHSSPCEDRNPFVFDHPAIIAATSAATSASKSTKKQNDAPLVSPQSASVTSRRTVRKFVQSYSHPDATNIVFTDENKLPRTSSSSDKVSGNNSSYICTKTGVAIHSKRLSSPNIGNFTQLDIAIHPDFLVTVQKHKAVPQNSLESASSFDDSAAEDDPEALRLKLKYAKIVSDTPDPAEEQLKLCTSASPADTECNTSSARATASTLIEDTNVDSDINKGASASSPIFINNNAKQAPISATFAATTVLDAAQFFKESGILGGDMGSAISGLFRKHSKVIPLHHAPNSQQAQEPVVVSKDQIRRNSLALMKQISDMRRKSIADDYEYLRNTVIPNLKRELSEYEIKVATMDDDISSLRAVIKARDDEIIKLKTEIHKLKSVLQQTAATTTITAATNDNAHINNLPAIVEQLSAEQQAQVAANEPNANYEVFSEEGMELADGQQEAQLVGLKRPNTHLSVPQQLVKKQGVSGESCDTARQTATDISIQKYDKDFRSKQLIKDAIMDNDFLKHIDSLQVRELVESMYSREYPTGEYVIREGEVGAHLYVSAEGEFEVIKGGSSLGIMGPGKAFGELAILYNCTRTATIRAKTNSRVWVLDRRVFQHIMMRTGIQRMEENVSFLKSVSLLKNLSNDVLTKIADVLEVEFYPAGAYIIRQGASGDTFFLISQGTVKVTQRVPGSPVEEEIRILGRGEYFGEQALIKEDKRTANIIAMSPGVECLTLDRDSFVQLIGNFCEEIHLKDYGDHTRVFASKTQVTQEPGFPGELKQEMLDIDLKDLEVCATLGIGGFGRVELVKCEKNGNLRTFALKCLKKKHIVETKQEEHVYNERKIMLSCNTSFICRLYRTYRDSKYVYMLLEACLGGEVWTILRDKGNFDDNTTKFIIACVLEAFDYLHTRGIVYRDLKPENLMLDANGYVKLVDFGFAKYIGHSNKTWTFCGTPEYVAPEIILNKGHDRAVDCWSLGILIHELLTGTPPFAAQDPMKTYNLILKGIDMIDFPRHMSRTAISLIKRLCRDAPAERLGYQRGGIQEIKKHKWFHGFDWDGLSSLTLTPPIVQAVNGPTDSSNFDEFPSRTEVPPDELSGWDMNF